MLLTARVNNLMVVWTLVVSLCWSLQGHQCTGRNPGTVVQDFCSSANIPGQCGVHGLHHLLFFAATEARLSLGTGIRDDVINIWLPPFPGFPRVRDPYVYVKPFDFINVENFYTKFIGIYATYIYGLHMCSWSNTCNCQKISKPGCQVPRVPQTRRLWAQC